MQDKKLGRGGQSGAGGEFLAGREMSYSLFSDGINVLPMVSACDYKRVNDGDKGPNTGGMGSYSPPVFDSPALQKLAMDTIMVPTIKSDGAGRPAIPRRALRRLNGQ